MEGLDVSILESLESRIVEHSQYHVVEDLHDADECLVDIKDDLHLLYPR